jgi:hypothetical protein
MDDGFHMGQYMLEIDPIKEAGLGWKSGNEFGFCFGRNGIMANDDDPSEKEERGSKPTTADGTKISGTRGIS